LNQVGKFASGDLQQVRARRGTGRQRQDITCKMHRQLVLRPGQRQPQFPVPEDQGQQGRPGSRGDLRLEFGPGQRRQPGFLVGRRCVRQQPQSTGAIATHTAKQGEFIPLRDAQLPRHMGAHVSLGQQVGKPGARHGTHKPFFPERH